MEEPIGTSAWYVEPRSSEQVDAWSEELAQAGQRGSQQLKQVEETVPPPIVAQALTLPPGEPVVARRRVMLVEEEPVELTDSYYPRAVASGTGLALMKKIRGGAPTLLAELGYVAGEVVEDLCVRQASADEARELQLSEETLVIELVRVSTTAEGVPFEVSVMVMRPEGRRFRYRLKAG